jgi:hypothetical protein
MQDGLVASPRTCMSGLTRRPNLLGWRAAQPHKALRLAASAPLDVVGEMAWRVWKERNEKRKE